jgi:hypothetical protein
MFSFESMADIAILIVSVDNATVAGVDQREETR